MACGICEKGWKCKNHTVESTGERRFNSSNSKAKGSSAYYYRNKDVIKAKLKARHAREAELPYGIMVATKLKVHTYD